MVIQINNNGQAVGVGSEKLSRFGSLLIKTGNLCPMSYPDWRTAPGEVTEPLWEIMRVSNFSLLSLPSNKHFLQIFIVYCLFVWIVEKVLF